MGEKFSTMGWLAAYGMQQHVMAVTDLDITDKLQLEEQINASRREWASLIALTDSIQGELMEIASKMSKRVQEVTATCLTQGTRLNAALSMDAEYTEMEAKQRALQAGLSMVRDQCDFVRNDLRLLQGAMYSKF